MLYSAERNPDCTLAAEVYGFDRITDSNFSNSAGSNSSATSTSSNTSTGTGTVEVSERHRHRYEVNPERVAQLEATGLHFTGRDSLGVRMEISELDRDVHPFYFGEFVCFVFCFLYRQKNDIFSSTSFYLSINIQNTQF